MQDIVKINQNDNVAVAPVSYTHLTLPTRTVV